MAIRWKHDDSTILYFCTFTCYNWLPLIEKVNGYDMVYKWFDHLKQQEFGAVAYVIMPNHIHSIPEPGFNLNKIIGNAKRFMATGRQARRLYGVRKTVMINERRVGNHRTKPTTRHRLKRRTHMHSASRKLFLNLRNAFKE